MKASSKFRSLAAKFFSAVKGSFSWVYKKARTTALNKYKSMANTLKKEIAFLTTLMENPKQLSKEDFFNFFKRIPVLGQVVEGLSSGVNIVKKTVMGDEDACYRAKLVLRKKVPGMSLKKRTLDKCVAPLVKEDGDCYFPCPSNMEEYGYVCVLKCMDEKSYPCGLYCAKDEKTCDQKTPHAIDMLSAGTTVAKFVGESTIPVYNIIMGISAGLRFLDDVWHPICPQSKGTVDVVAIQSIVQTFNN